MAHRLIQLIQQWLAMNAKSKNPVAAQATSWVSQLVFSRCWNPKVGSKASEGMGMLPRREQTGKEQVSFFHVSPRLPAEGVAQMKGVSSHLKILIKSTS